MRPTSETTLYLARHGETDYNRLRIVQGRGVDSVLNATGRAQAAALATRFAGVELDLIVSSTLRRALETARAVAVHHPDVPLHTTAELEEMSWGIYEGIAHSPQIKQVFQSMQAEWRAGRFDRPIEGGESILDVQRRAVGAVERLVAQHAGARILVVAHGRLLRVLLASLLPDYGLERMEEVHHTNTGVNHVVHCDGSYRAHLLNCTAHLASAELIEVE